MELLEIKGLSVSYLANKSEILAVDDVSFNVGQSRAVAIVGESGCGKSTLAYTLMRILPSNAVVKNGRILFDKEDVLSMTEDEYRTKIRWKQIAYIPQGSFNALNPFIKIVKQVSESMTDIGELPKSKVTKRSIDLLNLVGIGKEYSEAYPHMLSGGMRQRSVIAMALACNPRLLIADEPTTALDVIVQAQIISLLKSLMEKLTLSLILISHDISLVTMICEEMVVMYAGTIVERQNSKDYVRNPLHPYSRLLLDAIPKMKGKKRRLRSIPGSPPDLRNPPSGCRFHPRCSYSRKKCEKDKPLLRMVKHRGNVACHYPLI